MSDGKEIYLPRFVTLEQQVKRAKEAERVQDVQNVLQAVVELKEELNQINQRLKERESQPPDTIPPPPFDRGRLKGARDYLNRFNTTRDTELLGQAERLLYPLLGSLDSCFGEFWWEFW